jgi:hypothetical protein
MGAASSGKLSDPAAVFPRDYLTALSGARAQRQAQCYTSMRQEPGPPVDRELHDSVGGVEVSYRRSSGLPLRRRGSWAIIDNTSGKTGATSSSRAGRPHLFITQLYGPKYVQRPSGELAENAVAPIVRCSRGRGSTRESPRQSGLRQPSESGRTEAFSRGARQRGRAA